MSHDVSNPAFSHKLTKCCCYWTPKNRSKGIRMIFANVTSVLRPPVISRLKHAGTCYKDVCLYKHLFAKKLRSCWRREEDLPLPRWSSNFGSNNTLRGKLIIISVRVKRKLNRWRLQLSPMFWHLLLIFGVARGWPTQQPSSIKKISRLGWWHFRRPYIWAVKKSKQTTKIL